MLNEQRDLPPAIHTGGFGDPEPVLGVRHLTGHHPVQSPKESSPDLLRHPWFVGGQGSSESDVVRAMLEHGEVPRVAPLTADILFSVGIDREEQPATLIDDVPRELANVRIGVRTVPLTQGAEDALAVEGALWKLVGAPEKIVVEKVVGLEADAEVAENGEGTVLPSLTLREVLSKRIRVGIRRGVVAVVRPTARAPACEERCTGLSVTKRDVDHQKEQLSDGQVLPVCRGHPDHVLEAGTTDVRRRKLAVYMESGFPEVWVLVPPGSRRAGYPRVTIHVREGGGYRTAEESGAIPGFAKDEIFRALTERPWSGSTWRAVERVARAMGAREGTGPEDDPLSRSLIREGEAKGRREERAAMMRELLLARSIEVSPTFADELALAGDVPAETLTAAAFACTDEVDFLRRVREAIR